MSVTVADLLKLPSLREAEVLGGKNGLTKIVSSISVLESTDPEVLVDGLFPNDEFFGSEIVITGFLNIVNDVECQCDNMRRLAEGGEVGLILFYVGVYLPEVDKKLIRLADEMDFVLICMPKGQKMLRYSEVLSDVTECIYRDRMHNDSMVSEILGRVSRLPKHQQSINTILKMLSDRLSASIVLTDMEYQIMNLIAWPRSIESVIKNGMTMQKELTKEKGMMPCTFLPNSHIYRIDLKLDFDREMILYLIKEGEILRGEILHQALDIVRIGINIWDRKHGEIAIHELVRAIIKDEPVKMRRLAEIFRIDVASIHEMWILQGENSNFSTILSNHRNEFQTILAACTGTSVMDIYDGCLLLFLQTPKSSATAEDFLQHILQTVEKEDSSAVMVRCSNLQNTSAVRSAFLCCQKYLQNARSIFPIKRYFGYGELTFAMECRKQADSREQERNTFLEPLRLLKIDKDEMNLQETLAAYLLDCESSVTKAAEILFLHKNTIKYRLSRISDLLGYRADKMPESMKLYRAAAVNRLIMASVNEA